ncbi:twin-arginine translocation signal domain-containing protein [Undibacterium arcticum]
MINRRGFLKLSALAAPGALSFGDVFAQSDVIQFGCPVPMSGPFAANGKFADMGMKLMLQKYGKSAR